MISLSSSESSCWFRDLFLFADAGVEFEDDGTTGMFCGLGTRVDSTNLLVCVLRNGCELSDPLSGDALCMRIWGGCNGDLDFGDEDIYRVKKMEELIA